MTTTQKEEFFLIQSVQKKELTIKISSFFWRRHPEVRPPLRFGGGSEPGIEVLQTFALPLGHGVFCTM